MIERDIEIINRLGLHARASARLVQALAPFASSVQLTHRGRQINAKSIMGLMMLAAGFGSVIRASVDGPDEETAMATLVDQFERRFDEAD
ncbi:MAG TPA: HPr family phosphocarrier protein [Candidatus Saccharimonadia bacterium]|nr:HPr family phosphocarrier protein [Candidatus Saccharimonadia bacterium]